MVVDSIEPLQSFVLDREPVACKLACLMSSSLKDYYFTSAAPKLYFALLVMVMVMVCFTGFTLCITGLAAKITTAGILTECSANRVGF
jgi:hypothetical protein